MTTSAMSGSAFTLAVLYDTQRDPEPLSRARAALAALGEDNDHARRNDAQVLMLWRFDPKAFLRAFGGEITDHLLARLARAGATSVELQALVDGAGWMMRTDG